MTSKNEQRPTSVPQIFPMGTCPKRKEMVNLALARFNTWIS